MHGGPKIAGIAALVGDPARASIVMALMAGSALTASELAYFANVTPQTASGHLAKLVDGGILSVAKQGRHRYFRLHSPLVGQMLEGIMAVAEGQPVQYHPHWRGGEVTSDGEAMLRTLGIDVASLAKQHRIFCRPCLDWSMRRSHIAGAVGAALFQKFMERGWLKRIKDSRALKVMPMGQRQMKDLFGVASA